jgi:nitrate reductase NapAB chaperone NapD
VIISGIVMASRPEHLVEMSRAVEAISWADVHFSDPSGRLVVTIEAADLDQSAERLRQLQELPRVLMAALAHFTIEEHAHQHPTVRSGSRQDVLSRRPLEPDNHR